MIDALANGKIESTATLLRRDHRSRGPAMARRLGGNSAKPRGLNLKIMVAIDCDDQDVAEALSKQLLATIELLLRRVQDKAASQSYQLGPDPDVRNTTSGSAHSSVLADVGS